MSHRDRAETLREALAAARLLVAGQTVQIPQDLVNDIAYARAVPGDFLGLSIFAICLHPRLYAGCEPAPGHGPVPPEIAVWCGRVPDPSTWEMLRGHPRLVSDDTGTNGIPGSGFPAKEM